MASKHWEAMPANDGPDVNAGEWQVFRVLDSGEEQWLGGGGDKDEMEWTAEYARALELERDRYKAALGRIRDASPYGHRPGATWRLLREIAADALKPTTVPPITPNN